MRRYWIILAVLILVNIVAGCHWFRGRKRRSTASEAQETRVWRIYFAQCMFEKITDYTMQGWSTNVDWSILQTVWKIDIDQWKCSSVAGQDTGDCWKLAIDEFVGGAVEQLAKTCIDEFDDDTRKGSLRYPVHNRKKRQVDLPIATTNYTQCLQANAGTIPGTQAMDFDALTDFVKKYTLYGCEACGANCSGHDVPLPPDAPPQWPYRFLALTRADAPIRNAIVKCNEQFFPGKPFWSSWSHWDPSCATNCQSPGVQSRSRTCRSGVDPTVEVNWSRCGKVCSERRPFTFLYYCLPPFWAAWGAWSSNCNTLCGNNMRSRSRKCSCGHDKSIEVSPDFCQGAVGENERKQCPPVPCYPPQYPPKNPGPPPIHPPLIYLWSHWESYGPCRGRCGNRNWSRSRYCQYYGYTVPRSYCETPSGSTVFGVETSPCPLPCWSKWSNWGACGAAGLCVTEGTRLRRRFCFVGNSQVLASRCWPGVESDSQGCLCDNYYLHF